MALAFGAAVDALPANAQTVSCTFSQQSYLLAKFNAHERLLQYLATMPLLQCMNHAEPVSIKMSYSHINGFIMELMVTIPVTL